MSDFSLNFSGITNFLKQKKVTYHQEKVLFRGSIPLLVSRSDLVLSLKRQTQRFLAVGTRDES